jgi:hypothetical protein
MQQAGKLLVKLQQAGTFLPRRKNVFLFAGNDSLAYPAYPTRQTGKHR